MKIEKYAKDYTFNSYSIHHMEKINITQLKTPQNRNIKKTTKIQPLFEIPSKFITPTVPYERKITNRTSARRQTNVAFRCMQRMHNKTIIAIKKNKIQRHFKTGSKRKTAQIELRQSNSLPCCNILS